MLFQCVLYLSEWQTESRPEQANYLLYRSTWRQGVDPIPRKTTNVKHYEGVGLFVISRPHTNCMLSPHWRWPGHLQGLFVTLWLDHMFHILHTIRGIYKELWEQSEYCRHDHVTLDGAVNVVTSLRAGRPKSRGLILGRGNSLILKNLQTGCQPQPASYSMGNTDIFCESKAAVAWSWPLVSF